MGLLPKERDIPGEGRIGFLSTFAEVHALVYGIAGGIVVALIDQWIAEKHKKQIQSELPYTIFGGFLGVAIIYLIRYISQPPE